MTIDFSALALSPNESRAARNFLGLSQAQAAEKSNLPAHKIKRFETGTYVPDAKFLQDLREFFEGQDYNFHDEDAPGARAKARGDVFQAGVIGETASSTGETDVSPSAEPGKPARPQKVNLQFMRIAPNLGNDQIDRVFGCIEENEAAIFDGSAQQITTSIWDDGLSTQSKAQAIALLRRLAENGLLYARLMGRDLLPVVGQEVGSQKSTASSHHRLFTSSSPTTGNWKTIGDLLQAAMTDMQLATIDGNKDALARRKVRVEPVEVLQALVG